MFQVNSPIEELERLADALGDPTRRSIFLLVRESKRALTAAEVAQEVGLHRTVARGHLERLVEAGLVSASYLHRGEGGRPPKVYSGSERRVDLQLPARQYELLAELLLETLEKFGEAAEVLARDVGFAFGRRLAEEGGGAGPAPLAGLALLERAGATIEALEENGRLHLRLEDCLFREVSTRRPGLVCSLDRALMEGVLSAGPTRYSLGDVRRRCADDDSCDLTFVANRVVQASEESRRPAPEEGER
jgi:predicted ArsR family transcriptional regulator